MRLAFDRYCQPIVVVQAGAYAEYTGSEVELDGSTIPVKGLNKGGVPPAEDLEGKARTKENVAVPCTVRTQRRVAVSLAHHEH